MAGWAAAGGLGKLHPDSRVVQPHGVPGGHRSGGERVTWRGRYGSTLKAFGCQGRMGVEEKGRWLSLGVKMG